jgi:hypothetical protein
MISQAAWKKTSVRYKERVIMLERGQLAVSIRDVANSFDLPVGVVRGLTKRLKSNTMINTTSDTGVNVITICNYDEYQCSDGIANTPTNTGDNTPPTHPQHTEQEDNKLRRKYSPTKPDDESGGGYPQDFLTFYSKYPNKVRKRAALKAYLAAVKRGHSLAIVLDGLDRYIAGKPEWQKWAHPSSWLNADGFLDEYEPQKKAGAKW